MIVITRPRIDTFRRKLRGLVDKRIKLRVWYTHGWALHKVEARIVRGNRFRETILHVYRLDSPEVVAGVIHHQLRVRR